MPLHFETIETVADRLRKGETTSVALTTLMLGRIRTHNPVLNAYVTITENLALEQAEQADADFQAGIDRGQLQGVPIAIKDNASTKGVRTTCGSKLFADWIPEEDASVVSKLQNVGAVMLGKTTMHELAYGMSGINPHFGATKNPWSLDHDPGGSSSGSAAAVAAGLAFAALGSDTGGSIRQPAHCCGIVGFKPSFGRVSKAGVYPLVWSMDHVGPLVRSVKDAGLVFDAIKGVDTHDRYSVASTDRPSQPVADVQLSKLRIGIVRRHFFEGRPSVMTLAEQALAKLDQAGAQLVELDIPDIAEALKAARVMFAEANAVFGSEVETDPSSFGTEIQTKIANGAKLTAVDYAKALHFRQRFRRRVEALFSQCDILAVPTAGIAAEPLNQRPEDHPHLAWKNTGIFNFSGHPAISIPCGLIDEKLPAGLMLVGKDQQDEAFLTSAIAVEDALLWDAVPTGFD